MVRTILSAAVSSNSSKYEIYRKFWDAVKKLNTLQSNAQTLEKIRKEKDKRAHLNIPRMEKFAERAGIQISDMDKLNIIHVSGTKGKGSTCAYCESILRQNGYKTGFFSSPHLVEVRERFCVDGQPLEREKFASYFWDVYNQLQSTQGDDIENIMPNYFGFLVVMAFHVFLQEKVDVAIMEVGIGGQYDSTNVIRNPLVVGVTSLGLDHVSVLGTTIDKIAWHKAGIFKPGVPAFTSPQVPEAMTVLKSRAAEIGCSLSLCPDLDQYGPNVNLGIQGCMQAVNASLSLQLCNTWMLKYKEKTKESSECEALPEDKSTNRTLSDATPSSSTCDILTRAAPFKLTKQHYLGLEQCRWLGRSQRIEEAGTTFYLDGAHTIESIEQCVNWYQGEASKELTKFQGNSYRVLIFNTTGNRDTTSLLLPLMRCDFDVVLFCPNLAYSENISAENPIRSPLSGHTQPDSDQTNNSVTKEMQLDRCEKNKEAWQAISREHKTVENGSREAADDLVGEHVELNGECSEPELIVSSKSSENSDEAQLLLFPTISHCVNWVRRKEWKCNKDKSLTTNNSDTVINDHSDSGNQFASKETETHSNGKPSLQVGNGDCADDTHDLNGGSNDQACHDGEPHVQVLVTGSLHLVGGALKVIWDNQS